MWCTVYVGQCWQACRNFFRREIGYRIRLYKTRIHHSLINYIIYETSVKGSLVDMIIFTNMFWQHAHFLRNEVPLCALIFFHLCPCVVRRSRVLCTPIRPTMELWTELMSLCSSVGICSSSIGRVSIWGCSTGTSSASSSTSSTGSILKQHYPGVSQPIRFRFLECVGSDGWSCRRQNHPLPSCAQNHNCTLH